MAVPQWWKHAILYQIYPRSFADSNNDGIGDLPGVIEKLDYLNWLGVNALWFSPFYPSPQRDTGYDISDFCNIDPTYGSLEDFDTLIAECRKRNIRVLLDFVPNHTSDKHQWFIESRKSKDNPYRDWYVWKDGINGGPPNDWESYFGGSAWEYDETTDQYYYHMFYKEQPDLNWENPEVRNAMYNVMRFWFDRGVDGFRIDAITHFLEDSEMRDSGIHTKTEDVLYEVITGGKTPQEMGTIFEQKFRYQENLPGNFDIIKQMRQVCDEYDDKILIGETELLSYYGNGSDMLHTVFNFYFPEIRGLDAEKTASLFNSRVPKIPEGCWDANTIGNHDRTRSIDHYSDGKDDKLRSKCALALIAFLPGTPSYYYGEEIGMRDLEISNPDVFQDPISINAFHLLKGRGIDTEKAVALANQVGRDRARTPMQWTPEKNAGFTSHTATPWLPIHPNAKSGTNVLEQKKDQDSMLNYFRRMLCFRQDNPAVWNGEFTECSSKGNILFFTRKTETQSLRFICNMGSRKTRIQAKGTLCFSTTHIFSEEVSEYILAPYQIIVLSK
ncbi:MAG: alpha-glucosidase [Spirochaetia bacterium]